MCNQSQFDPFPRSEDEERKYLLGRANDHWRMADKADDVGTRGIHMRLHRLYTEQAELIGVVIPDYTVRQKD